MPTNLTERQRVSEKNKMKITGEKKRESLQWNKFEIEFLWNEYDEIC